MQSTFHVEIYIWSKISDYLMYMIMMIHEYLVTRYTFKKVTTPGVWSQLLDILNYFHYSCPAPQILCIQFSFNLPDIH